MTDSLAHESDAALLERVRTGETEYFAELVRRYQGPLGRVARSRLGRRDWAEDVVQETFLAAFRSCGTYDARYSFRTWLWTILLNQCASYYHRQRRAGAWQAADQQPADAGRLDQSVDERATPLDALLARERTANLETFLSRLSTVQADALRLRFFGELKFHEIAETMQCSLNTAKNRVRWGLTRLSEMIRAAETSDAGAGGAASVDADEERNGV